MSPPGSTIYHGFLPRNITMTNKRKHLENHDGESVFYNKRSRLNNSNGSDDLPSSSQSRIDPTYGQRGAFPGLHDSNNDEELFYGPASDGLEYLRMVRSEAKTVPNLLVAPIPPTAQSEKNDLYADYPQGYYSDGAYTAAPVPTSRRGQVYMNHGQQEDRDPQEAYYASLCTRFSEHTEILQSPPPRAAPNNTDVYYLDWRKPRFWRGKILYTTPTMVLLAQLTQESVICGLETLESLLNLANLKGEKGKNIGAWIWGLLGKCREVGQMGSEEVGVLRKLGKQSLWLMRISVGDVIGGAVEEPDVDAGEEDGDEGEGNEGEGEKERVEDRADFLDAVDADDGYSSCIDPITTVAVGHDGNSETHQIATMSDADPVEAKQHLLNSLGTNQAQPDSTGANASKQDDIQIQAPTYSVTELEADDEGDSKKRADADLSKAKQHILVSLDTNQAQTDSTEINPSNEDGIQRPSPISAVTELEADGEGSEKTMIHATLDMLVTIIGEFYGQRDLLDGRLLWDEMQ